MKSAIMIVGGIGLRLRPITQDIPKCMVKLNGRPLLFWNLKWLQDYDFEKVVLGVAYKKEKVINYVKEQNFQIDISFSEHTVEGGTAEGFKKGISRFIDAETFLAMNGDEFTNLNLDNFLSYHKEFNSIGTIAVSYLQSPFGIIKRKGNKIIGFDEKPVFKDKLVSIGVYCFNRKILDYLPDVGSVEKDTFPKLAEEGKLRSYKLKDTEQWVTVNSIKDLELARKKFNEIRG